jgi:hypothetical protein
VYHKGVLIGAISCRLEPLDSASQTVKIHNQANASAQVHELCVPTIPSQPATSNTIVNSSAKRDLGTVVDSSLAVQGDPKRHKAASSIPDKAAIDAVTVAKILVASSQLHNDHDDNDASMLLAMHAEEKHTAGLNDSQQPSSVATQQSPVADIVINTPAAATTTTAGSSHNKSNCSKLYIMTLGVTAAYRYYHFCTHIYQAINDHTVANVCCSN